MDDLEDEEMHSNSFGLVCPKCKTGMIEIEANITVLLDGDDIEEQSGYEWDDSSSATCRNCDWSGTVKDLEEES